MNIKALIAAVDAPQLAKEAMERARLKSENQQDQDEIPELVKESFKKKKTEAQLKQELLKEKWRPTGYIFIWELLDLVGAWKFKEWTGEEIEITCSPPKCLQVSDDLDLEDTERLIFYAFSHGLIKEGLQQPPSILGDSSGIFQDEWLYLHRVGKFNGTKTKEGAVDGWLREAGFIVEENRQYNTALERVDQVKKFLRDVLYAGKIKTVRVIGKNLEPVSRSYWLEDNFAQSLNISPTVAEILFEHKSAQIILKVINEQTDSEQKGLVRVSGGQDLMRAANSVYTECRARDDKLSNKELHELVNRILKNNGKTLPKSWHKTGADIPPDLKRTRGEHGKCTLILDDWPESESI
jgi:hypothetical protein